SFATCGGNGGGTLPCFARPSANFVCLIAETIPCGFGTSSVSRSQPVVFAEGANHFACFAPLSWSAPCLTDSAPSFAIPPRGAALVFAEVTNHFACFAPMSWSTPCLTDSAPSFAIASRGSTPFGQRWLQK